VVGDTVGDPFKDTSSVAMNRSSSSRRCSALLAVELAVNLKESDHEACWWCWPPPSARACCSRLAVFLRHAHHERGRSDCLDDRRLARRVNQRFLVAFLLTRAACLAATATFFGSLYADVAAPLARASPRQDRRLAAS